MLESYPLVTTVVISIVLAFLFGLIANRLKLPTILGYLIAGIIIGPNTPGFVANINIAEQLAEIGVILLMFGVGLHFSIKDLQSVKKIAIPGAIVQMLVTCFLCLVVAMSLNHGFIESLVFGVTLSVASTVVLLRTLEQYKLTDSHIGKVAIGWLIIEDIAMVVILVLLPVIYSMMADKASLDFYKIFKLIILVVFKVIAFLMLMVIFGKKLLPRLLVTISKTESHELMVLGTIAISSGFAFLAYTVFGTSFALGAFMAGFVLNESSIGRKYADKSLALRDLFAVLFFVATGMLFNPKILLQEPVLILVAFLLVTLGKLLITYFIMKLFRQEQRNSLLLAASLAQIGEFSFILAALSLKLGIFSTIIYDMVIASAIISIALNPFLFKMAKLMRTKKS